MNAGESCRGSDFRFLYPLRGVSDSLTTTTATMLASLALTLSLVVSPYRVPTTANGVQRSRIPRCDGVDQVRIKSGC